MNVGAGTGSYESANRRVIAVEPSDVMLSQRAAGSAPAVRAVAERLPFSDGAAEAVLAVLTVHHWADWRSGIDELCRVAPLRVVLTYYPLRHMEQWLIREYVPEVAELEADRPLLDDVCERLGATSIIDLPLSRVFCDGVMGAFWCRPRAYLDPRVRQNMSGLALLPEEVVGPAMCRLADDLESGKWVHDHRALLHAANYDAGFRLVVSRD
ncbi:MAG TPA: methyltransferase domain-containing protein [Acidimicrobiales bacterium]|nr:methyltransferase domain-containing protein [Acidimicrobiales bacterium]